MVAEDPTRRRALASLAARDRWSKTDNRTEATAPARAGAAQRFEARLDPEGLLRLVPDEIRDGTLTAARREHFGELARRSAAARRRRRRERLAAAGDESELAA